MRRDAHLQARIDKFFGVVALVRPQRDVDRLVTGCLARRIDHDFGRFTLGMTIGRRHHCIRNRAMPVVAQGVAHEAQLAGCLAFAVQPRIGVGAGLVRVVTASLAFEVGTEIVIAVVVAIVVLATLAYKALVAGPGLNQRAVDAEVLAREPTLVVGGLDDQTEQLDDRVVGDQAFAVLCEDGGHPHAVVHGQADEPAKQQVVLGLLHELTLGAHAVKDLQQHGAQQFLGGNAGATALGISLVHAGEQAVHLDQRLVHHHAYRAQRMVGGNEILQLAQGEQTLGEGVGAAHVGGLESEEIQVSQ